MLACAPESGSRTPTFSGPPCARAKSSGALATSNPAAPAPAAKLRRVMEFVGDARVMCGSPWSETISPGSRATMARANLGCRRSEEAPMDESPVLVERRAGYRVITLNRPRQLNAFNEAMQQALKRTIAEAEEDCDCRALLLTGAGHAFCAGQDLRERITADGKTTVLGSTLDTYYNPLVRKLRTLPFPVVAAVNGVAAGAGANIALACDVVLAARSASFVQAFAKIGLIPDCGGTWFLP